MSKRAADIVISTPASKVRRRLNFDSPYACRAAAPIVRVTKQQAWTNRPMNRKPECTGCTEVRMFQGDERVPVRYSRLNLDTMSFILVRYCVFRMLRVESVCTHRIGKRFCVKSVYVLGKIWMDENIKTKNHTNSVMFFLVRDRRPVDKPQDFGEVFNMFDNEPSTATVKNSHRDRYQVLRKWHATVTGGQYASKEQALVKKFVRVNNYVVYNQQEAGKYENHTENALMLYMACTHASNPVYATLKIRIYFYDSVTN
ncbi:AV1 [Cotton leaf curl Alabad virus]|uniref:Capsid protein n=1 Tax=Cotton leaf curl Alabad virus TaxID=222456 RepID=C9W8J9_9GEMI|nr:AV1 [Cotton leaf curl Alabad virus]